MSIMLIMSCYTGFFNACGEGGNLLTRDLGFIYVSSAGRVGCEFMHPTQPTDAPSSRRSSRSHFYISIPGVPAGFILVYKPSNDQRTRMHSCYNKLNYTLIKQTLFYASPSRQICFCASQTLLTLFISTF